MTETALCNHLFMAFLLRLAGTAGWYGAYADFARSTKQVGTDDKRLLMIPGIGDLQHYIDFLIKQTPGGREGRMARFTKSLYHASLPGDCNSTVGEYCDFLERISVELVLRVRETWQSRKSIAREDWVSLVDDVLKAAITKPKRCKRTMFLSGLIVADVEEIWVKPFGEARNVYLGSGGRRGLQMLETPATMKWENNLSKSRRILDFLNDQADDVILTALGLERVNDTVRIKINRRPLEISDVDNIACKISISQGRTTGARLIIRNPALNNVYDFPILHQWKRYFNMGALQGIALEGVAVLRAIGREIHHQFKFQDEDERWPAYCRKMTEYWSTLNNEVTGSDGEEDSLNSGQILDENETDVVIREPTKTKKGLSLEESDVDGMEEEESVASEKSVLFLGWGVLDEDDDDDDESVICAKKTKKRIVLEESDGDGFEEEESVTSENSEKDDDEDSVVCAKKTKRRFVLEESDGEGFEEEESVTSENSEASARFLGRGVVEEDDDEDPVSTTKKRRMLLESDGS
jgi:hypothetical protein